MKRITILLLIVFTCFVLAAWPQTQGRWTDAIIFDAPGAGTGPYQGTTSFFNNPAGTITGYYVDANYVTHGFVRTADGDITSFDPPNSVSTTPQGINPAGAITGYYADA